MPKAHIKTPEGIIVAVEGTATEISAVVQKLRAQLKSQSVSRPAKTSRRATLGDLIASLIDSGFFSKPRTLGDVKAALAEMGHLYPVTTLSPVMLRQVRRRSLRRIKEKKFWVYTLGRGMEATGG